MSVLKSLVVAFASCVVSVSVVSAMPDSTIAAGRSVTVTAEGPTECAAVQGAKRKAEAAVGTRFNVVRSNVRQVGNRWIATWTVQSY